MVLLISLNQEDLRILRKTPSDISTLGVRHISSYLKSQGEGCKIVFLSKKFGKFESRQELKEIESFIKKLKPDVIGLGLMSNHYPRAVKITEDIKRYYSGPVVWGGIHPTMMPEECLNFADFVFVGEAEHSFSEFYKEYKNNVRDYQTRGIVYKKEGKTINNGIYPLCQDLDKLPFPDYDLGDHYIFSKGKLVQMNEKLLRQFLPFFFSQYRITATRGCPFNCTYCGSAFLKNMYDGKILRTRSVDKVLEELTLVKSRYPYLESIKVMDDCFTVNSVEWLREFSNKYREKIGMPFYCLIIPSTLTEEKLKVLVEAGLNTVQVGLQSGSDRVNKEIYLRNASQDQFLKTISILSKQNLLLYIDVIVENPYEKEEDHLETAKVLNQIPRPYNLGLYSLAFYPGTGLYNRAQKDGFSQKKLKEYLTKEFHNLENTYFNKLFRVIPVLGKKQVNNFIENRKKIISRMRLSLYYFLYVNRDMFPSGLRSFLKKIVG